MTAPAEIVESPFGRRHVQITIAVFASVALFCLSVTSWHASSGQDQRRLDLAETDDALVTALIQIDLNTAESRELALLPGVGPILAKRIVDNRIRLGPYRSLDDLGRVHGIGPRTLRRIQHLCVVDSGTSTQQGGGPVAPPVASQNGRRLASAQEIDVPNRQDSFDRASR